MKTGHKAEGLIETEIKILLDRKYETNISILE